MAGQPRAGGNALNESSLARLRVVSHAAALVGAVGSVALFLYAGRAAPRSLWLPFVLWVVSPYALLWIASAASKRWSPLTQAALQGVSPVIALASLALYAIATFGPSRARPAPFFVIVPPASWLLIAIVLGVGALASRRRASSQGGAS